MFRAKGFTLIELLTVVFVLGVMVALLLPVINQFQRDAVYKQTQAVLASLSTAVESYKLEFGAYPPSEPISLETRYSVVDADNAHECLVGRGALHYYLNGDDGGGYVTKQGNRRYPPRVTSVRTASWDPDGAAGPVPPGRIFVDAWGNPNDDASAKSHGIEYFRAHTDRGSTVAAIYPRACRATYPLAGADMSGYTIELPIQKWLPGWPKYRCNKTDGHTAVSSIDGVDCEVSGCDGKMNRLVAGWQDNAIPYNTTTFILASPGRDGLFGSRDDVVNAAR